MFNIANRVSLAAFADLGEIVRPADIFGVGKIASRVPARLVPATTQKALAEAMATIDVTAIAVPEQLSADVPENLGVLVTDDPIGTCSRIHARLHTDPSHYWTDFPSVVHPAAQVDRTAAIAERNVVIGANVVIDANVVVRARSLLGEGCSIGAGSVIGSDAFELVEIGGARRLQTQAGGVRIGRDVVILSNVAIARSAFATFTEIEDECAIDNLVHIAHDCHLARGVQVTAGAVLAGRVSAAQEAFVGPNATISNGVSIGEGGHVTIGATVIRDVDAGGRVSGNFAVDHQLFMRRHARPDG